MEEGNIMRNEKEFFFDTDLYCITAERYSSGKSNTQVVKEFLQAGIKIIQYREKEKSMLEQYEECKVLRRMVKDYGAKFIVNDHVALAIAVKADGIHIGQNDLPLEVVRDIVGKKMIIGLSVNTIKEVNDAVKVGADYIGVGPVFATSTKKDTGSPIGLEKLKYIVKNFDIPIVPIGGINEKNVSSVYKCRVDCICLVSEIVGAVNIGEKIIQIRKQLNGRANKN